MAKVPRSPCVLCTILNSSTKIAQRKSGISEEPNYYKKHFQNFRAGYSENWLEKEGIAQMKQKL